MLIGRLDQRVTIAAPSTAIGADGHPAVTYPTPIEVWAQVTGQRGEESFIAARTESRRIIKVLLRFRDDLTTAWRLTWNGEVYDITDVDRSKERAGELWLMCMGRRVS